MMFTWLVVFVVIGITGSWWWENHKAQQEDIATMADESSAQLAKMVSYNRQNRLMVLMKLRNLRILKSLSVHRQILQ